MKTIEMLMSEYVSISKQLAYYVGAKNVSHIAIYSVKQQEAAMRLILALSQYHGFNSDDIELAMDKAMSDG